MLEIDDMIDSPTSREIKRALAVKMILCDFKTKAICSLLNVSEGFVSKWKVVYENEGAKGLRLKYKGGKGFLTETQRIETLLHLKKQPHYGVEELSEWMQRRFGVTYQSRQSYYDLLKAAGLSWHQTQAINPKRDEEEVELKRHELKKTGDPRSRNRIWRSHCFCSR
jgi:transposase